MTILFAGGELDAIIPSDSSVIESTTINSGAFTSRYNATYSRCAILVPTTSAYAETPSWSQAGTFWFHGRVNWFSNLFNKSLLSFYDGSTEVFRLLHDGSANTAQMYYLSAASTFTAIGSSFTLDDADAAVIDVKLVQSTGEATIYVAGTQRATGTVGAMTQFTGVTKVRLKSANSGAYWSQILCSTTSTVGRVVSTKYPTGNGANTSWVGDYTGVDEAVYSDADGITSSSANEVETYTGNTPTVNGFKVEAVVVNARAKRGETGPANLQLALRTSATNYVSSSHALTLGYTGESNVWETNPNTSAAWVTATAQAVEFGVKSIT